MRGEDFSGLVPQRRAQHELENNCFAEAGQSFAHGDETFSRIRATPNLMSCRTEYQSYLEHFRASVSRAEDYSVGSPLELMAKAADRRIP